MRWEDIRDNLWAKSPLAGQTGGELLDQHTLEVLKRLSQLSARFPKLAEQAEDEGLWHRMFWACFLHDIGKAAPQWQLYVRPGGRPWIHRHEVASLAFLPWVIDPGSADFPWIAASIVSHHRDASVIDQRYPLDYPEGMALDQMFAGFDEHTLSGLLDWFAHAPARWVETLGLPPGAVKLPAQLPDSSDAGRFRSEQAAEAVLLGLSAYRQLRRNIEDGTVQTNRAAILHRGLLLLSDHLGSAHAASLLTLDIPGDGILSGRPMRDHQRAAATARRSVVLRAPTGSGKTEAALLWASRQQSDRPEKRTMYYLLPYQASINAMQSRLEATLRTKVGLLHGRSLQVLYRRLLSNGYNSQEAEKAARWARNLARLRQPAVNVTTPYQLLRAAYRLRGFEAVWTGFMGSLIIVDEVHAYEPERMGLVLGLLARLVRDWHVDVCALTATMPSWLQLLLVESLSAQLIKASENDFKAFQRHELHVFPGDLQETGTLEFIAARVTAGEAVLVGANTVSRAQRAWSQLCASLGESRVMLLHSRFTGRDRLAHESSLLSAYGLDSRDRTAGVVVATQAIEVSLNLDFDRIITEPAPLEALAQRFGRVNRKGRLQLAPVHVLTQPAGGQRVYDDRLVERSLAVLKEWDGRPLDEAQLTVMLDEVYGTDLSGEFQDRVSTSRVRFERFCLDSLHAFDSDEALEDQFDELFDGVEVLPGAFEPEFREAVENAPLESAGLMVPIQHRQLARLRRAGHARRGVENTWVVDAPYHPVQGLQL